MWALALAFANLLFTARLESSLPSRRASKKLNLFSNIIVQNKYKTNDEHSPVITQPSSNFLKLMPKKYTRSELVNRANNPLLQH
ncbi:hypothetical protein EVAR_83643_1 [Eumeta japonica]|uniref:Secreted protein n=1 Tax=Eumeta variegata TaxID=151549 RepID=A0A4C1UPV7_EUMVA|nr:hypothetical protein EVAR_83643_1 [Eumeta japonica]